MYALTDLQDMVYRDLAHPSTNNDRLTTARINVALNQGYKEFARLTRCFHATRTIAAVTTQQTYALPPDILEVTAVRYSSESGYLTRASLSSLTYRVPTWRVTAAGTPTTYYMADVRTLGLYPKPSFTGSVSLYVDGYIVPYSVVIATTARVTNVTTITTNKPHGFTASDLVRIGGVTPAGATYFYKDSITPGAVADKTFTYADAASNDTGTGGYASYATGVPYMGLPILYAPHASATADKGDLSQLTADYDLALADFAVWTLASRYLNDADEAMARATVAKEAFYAKIEQAKAELK